MENTLAGKADLLKQRTLGVEVFDRPPSYDTNADTVARYTAGEVRKRLSLYYHELDRKPLIHILLPAGSYVPEFVHAHDEQEEPSVGHTVRAEILRDAAASGNELDGLAVADTTRPVSSDLHLHSKKASSNVAHKPRLGPAIAAVLAILIAIGAGWRYRFVQQRTPIDDFWGPVLRDQKMVPICTGGSVFAQNNFSGVATAGKDIDYPFVSMQAASAIAQVSALLEHHGATTRLDSAATTPLTDLREHSVIFLGGYNNQWTLRLLQPLRFHFAPEINASIVDTNQPGVGWARDRSLPYSSEDDYALEARFRDPTTDSWVVVLAGLGRNGSEAAAQFATSPHYMQLLRDWTKSDFSNRNVEAVLRVSVIDGKTGAPSILAAHLW